LQTLDRLKPTEENNNNEDSDIEGLKFYHDYISKTDLDPKSLEFLESTLVFTGASYETTADVLANTLLLLAMNPDKQEILFNEIKSVLDSPDDCVSEEQIELMPYLGLTIKEGLRMLPAAVVSSAIIIKV
jgi:cytochrome P450